jgi:serine/threonine protein kinase/predicted Zn-dependent protease
VTERSLFLALLEIEDPTERAAYLDRACADAPALRQQVEQLLNSHQRSGALAFMELPAASRIGAEREGPPVSEAPGTIIGPYKLLEQIGEGGFGVVFMAEQQRPVRRQVALKVLKAGMDTRQVVARFEAERQALALMNHPHIAHVLDGGETASGRPFFVMELVRGIPITDFCRQNQLGVPERLRLFLEVCGAVQHAHQKGIIHRDLKPSNVLVMMHDTIPIVKVIDFGIAKAMGQQLTEKTLFTNFAHLIGTPTYMSPEQAQMSGLDIDTRTDVYSLGVILYELITGTTPFDRQRLGSLAYDEIRRIIREEEPPRPSARISTLAAAEETMATGRSSERRRLNQWCRGELDWIVMKALEKDRARRYDTVGALAADVERYLRDEPVQACPPSRWYQFRKFARRNRAAFVSGAALAAVVLLALAGLAVSNIRISREQLRTGDERDRADKAQHLAEQRAAQIEEGIERLKKANDLVDRARWYVYQQRPDDAYRALTRAAELRPDHAAVWVELSDLHTRLGLWDAAALDFARELELRGPDLTGRWFRHALLRLAVDDAQGYREVRQRMHARFRGTLTHPFLLDLMRTSSLGQDPDPELPALSRLADDLPFRGWYMLHLSGAIDYRAGRYEQAVRRLRDSLALDTQTPPRALNFPFLAMAHYRLGQTAEARQAMEEARATIDHWTNEACANQGDPRWMNHLGAEVAWPVEWWDWLQCHLQYREAKLLIDGTAPPPDPRLYVLRARAFAGLRDHSRADAEYALASRELADDRRVLFESHRNRGYLHAAQERWSEAADAFARSAALQPDEVRLWFFEAVARGAAGERAAYREACEKLLTRFEKTADPFATCFVVRACVLLDEGSAPGSAATAGSSHRLIEMARAAAPFGYFADYVQGAALYRAGRIEEAVGFFDSLRELYRPRAWEWCFLAMSHQRRGRVKEARKCLAEAARWIEEANRNDLEDLTGNSAAWGDWPERAEYPLLLREAEALIAGADR